MHGPLHEIGLIEVLQLLERGARSGVLRLVGPDAGAPRTVRLHRGRVVSIEPDAGDAALGRALVRRHVVPPDERDAAALDPALREAVRQRLARAALGAMLHWKRGRFDFSEAVTEPGPLDWSADALVFSLVEDESRRVELAEELDEWHAVPGFTPVETIAAGARLDLDPLDWRILDAVGAERDVAAIAALLDEPLEDVGGRIRALVAAAILQLHPAAPPVGPSPPDDGQLGGEDDLAARLRARVRRQPEDGEGWRLLGLAEVGNGQFEAAIAAWTTWQRVAPERADDAATLIVAARTMTEALRESDG